MLQTTTQTPIKHPPETPLFHKVCLQNRCARYIHTHTHSFNSPFSGTTRSAGTRKVKSIWILLKQDTVSGSGISWDICKSAPRSRQITTPAPHHSVFTGWMPFLPPNQQRQSTNAIYITNILALSVYTYSGQNRIKFTCCS